jgi:hypothetical protein
MAAQVKRGFNEWIAQYMPDTPVRSYLHADSSAIRVPQQYRNTQHRCRVTVCDRDLLETAVSWYEANKNDPRWAGTAKPIPIVNMANEKRAGGDWESGLIAPEECLARRSNLVKNLETPWYPNSYPNGYYPLPQKGGLYSPSVGMLPGTYRLLALLFLACLSWEKVVFRDGPEQYQVWQEFKTLPVISVAPVRRPKLDETGEEYSFQQERDLMQEKMRTVLRIAAQWQHRDLCLGAFGVGPAFRNPAKVVARMWRELIFEEPEFDGAFSNIVFCIESNQAGNPKGGAADLEVFRQEFDARTVYPTTYR